MRTPCRSHACHAPRMRHAGTPHTGGQRTRLLVDQVLHKLRQPHAARLQASTGGSKATAGVAACTQLSPLLQACALDHARRRSAQRAADSGHGAPCSMRQDFDFKFSGNRTLMFWSSEYIWLPVVVGVTAPCQCTCRAVEGGVERRWMALPACPPLAGHVLHGPHVASRHVAQHTSRMRAAAVACMAPARETLTPAGSRAATASSRCATWRGGGFERGLLKLAAGLRRASCAQRRARRAPTCAHACTR